MNMTAVIYLNPKNLFVTQSKKAKITDFDKIAVLYRSVQARGLLNPLMVKETHNGYIIIDGVKRFLALRMLKKKGMLPRTLEKIPCVLSGDDLSTSASQPMLISDRHLALNIEEERTTGRTDEQISDRYACSLRVVEQVKSLTVLHPDINAAFRRGDLTLAQASAFTTLPDKPAQWALLLALGPFVCRDRIMAEISKGQTVVDLPDGDTLILPSQSKKTYSPCRTAA